VEGIAAALLPYGPDGCIDFDSYHAVLSHISSSGLTCAVNMDTGYVNLLTIAERDRVLREAEHILTGQPFVAGLFVEGMEGDLESLYCREAEKVVSCGGMPIVFQSARMQSLSAAEKAALYARIADASGEIYVFELGKMFAPNGEIWDDETFARILEIPGVKGAKHSSLNRLIELDRLKMRDEIRPDFKIFTGNDLGIDMIEYGSDYLLGLAAFCPNRFKMRDGYWVEGNIEYYALSDALQHLGNCAFRTSVPAYKHSAACFLYCSGIIACSEPHPMAPRRPSWELDLMRSCAERLGSCVR
jgi:dihydrodipicolinate synthase/N-acetylneuraminate lyase